MISDRRFWTGATVGLLGLAALGCSADAGGLVTGDGQDTVPVADTSVDGQDGDQTDVGTESELEFVRPVVEIPDQWESAIDELYGRYQLYWDAFAAAYGPPNADPTYQPLKQLSTEPNWESLELQLQDFAADEVVLVLPEDSETEHMIRLPNDSLLSKDEGAEVILQDCWIDDFVQQTEAGRVLSEVKEAKLMNVVMRVVDGEWLVDGVSRATPESDGYEQCVTLG